MASDVMFTKVPTGELFLTVNGWKFNYTISNKAKTKKSVYLVVDIGSDEVFRKKIELYPANTTDYSFWYTGMVKQRNYPYEIKSYTMSEYEASWSLFNIPAGFKMLMHIQEVQSDKAEEKSTVRFI